MKGVVHNCKGFQWDEDNSEKSWYLHQVTDSECEEVFFNLSLIVASATNISNVNKDISL